MDIDSNFTTQKDLNFTSQSPMLIPVFENSTEFVVTNGTTLHGVKYLESKMGPQRIWGLPVTIILTIVYCVIFFSGGIGNVCTCIVIIRNRYMHTATNYYLFSLAISDALTLILGKFQFLSHIIYFEFPVERYCFQLVFHKISLSNGFPKNGSQKMSYWAISIASYCVEV